MRTGVSSVCFALYLWFNSLDSPNAPYSICPKGWGLPQAFGGSSSDYINGDYYTLATAHGVVFENAPSSGTSTFYDNAGPNTLPNFLLANYNSAK